MRGVCCWLAQHEPHGRAAGTGGGEGAREGGRAGRARGIWAALDGLGCGGAGTAGRVAAWRHGWMRGLHWVREAGDAPGLRWHWGVRLDAWRLGAMAGCVGCTGCGRPGMRLGCDGTGGYGWTRGGFAPLGRRGCEGGEGGSWNATGI